MAISEEYRDVPPEEDRTPLVEGIVTLEEDLVAIEESEYPCSLFDEDCGIFDDFNYGLPFDNDIGPVFLDYSKCSSFSDFCSEEISPVDVDMISDKSDVFDRESDHLCDFDFDSIMYNLASSENKVKLERGVSLFDEHFQQLKNEDNHQSENFDCPSFFIVESESSYVCDETISIIEKDKIKRQKNNEASRKSRAERKRKIKDMDNENESIMKENEALQKKISEVEGKISHYRRLLLRRPSKT